MDRFAKNLKILGVNSLRLPTRAQELTLSFKRGNQAGVPQANLKFIHQRSHARINALHRHS